MTELTDSEIIELYQELMRQKTDDLINQDEVYISNFIAVLDSITSPGTLSALTYFPFGTTFMSFYEAMSRIRAILSVKDLPNLDVAFAQLQGRVLNG